VGVGGGPPPPPPQNPLFNPPPLPWPQAKGRGGQRGVRSQEDLETQKVSINSEPSPSHTMILALTGETGK